MEEQLQLWRDNLIQPVIEDGKWYRHPTLNYEGNTQGELRNITSKKLVLGHIAGRYRRVKGGGAYHRLLMECFYNVTIPPQYDIDHKDANPLNNTFDNLQILTKKEHAQKTAKQNPDKGKKSGVKSSRRIVRFRIGENGERIDEVFFDGVKAAARLGCSWKRIMRSIEGSIPDRKGYYWAWTNECDNDDLPDEEWRQVPGFREGMFVSNKGRVWFKYLPNPYKTFGSPTSRGYLVFRSANMERFVHGAVILAFTGPPPTDDHTVDHIDQNKENNCVGNLRWATASEQSKNRRSMRPIEIYHPANPAVAIKTFDTEREAAAEYGTTQPSVSRAVHGTRAGENRNPFSAYYIKQGSPLSARFADMTNEEKMNRELSFLDHQVEDAKKDKGRRKSNNLENLPIGVWRRKNGLLIAQMTFLGERFYMSGQDPTVLAREREEWFNKVVEDHKAFIRQSFDNNAPQYATGPIID